MTGDYGDGLTLQIPNEIVIDKDCWAPAGASLYKIR